MRKLFFFLFFAITFTSLVNATEISTPQTHIYYFWQVGCSHCANVDASGILEKVGNMSNVVVEKYEIRTNATSRQVFLDFADKFKIPDNQRGTPFLVIEKNGQYSYMEGDSPIINNLTDSIINFKPIVSSEGNQGKNITLGAVIIAALIDSINPCAFGVLIFLMLSLLNMGSSKRALKAGLIYTFVVFVTYFLAGLGIFHVIQQFTSITRFIYITAGVLVLALGTTQLIDVFLPGKFISLRIPVKAKPTIERIMAKGTIPAIILLGIVVSLFELPCTGGIYIGILTMMAVNKTFALSYLIIYNLIFILPLVILTLIIYKGTKPETLQAWTSKERNWMKLASGLIMLALGIYILISL